MFWNPWRAVGQWRGEGRSGQARGNAAHKASYLFSQLALPGVTQEKVALPKVSARQLGSRVLDASQTPGPWHGSRRQAGAKSNLGGSLGFYLLSCGQRPVLATHTGLGNFT